MYRGYLDRGSLPPSLNTAVNTLLLKPGITLTPYGSYRLISLLNNDLKILCKLLARRLKLLLPKMTRMSLGKEGRAFTILKGAVCK